MNSKPILFRPWALGLMMTLLQIFAAVVLIAPEGPLSYRYDTLIQHDSFWFANIVDRGYDTTVPPDSREWKNSFSSTSAAARCRVAPPISMRVRSRFVGSIRGQLQ